MQDREVARWQKIVFSSHQTSKARNILQPTPIALISKYKFSLRKWTKANRHRQKSKMARPPTHQISNQRILSTSSRINSMIVSVYWKRISYRHWKTFCLSSRTSTSSCPIPRSKSSGDCSWHIVRKIKRSSKGLLSTTKMSLNRPRKILKVLSSNPLKSTIGLEYATRRSVGGTRVSSHSHKLLTGIRNAKMQSSTQSAWTTWEHCTSKQNPSVWLRNVSSNLTTWKKDYMANIVQNY